MSITNVEGARVVWPIKKSTQFTIDNFTHNILNELPLEYCILLLPIEVRHRIGIYCIKQFWREYIPLTAQVPSWYKPYTSMQTIKYDMVQKNIHFMHLDCNTLPHMKDYILGCQCDFCKRFINKDDNLLKIYYMYLKNFTEVTNTSYILYNGSYLNHVEYNPYYDILPSS